MRAQYPAARRFPGGSFHLVLAVLLSAGLPAFAEESWSGPIRVRADRCEVREIDGEIRAEGRVRVELVQRTITADVFSCRFVLQPETGRRIITQLTASGDVTFIEQRRLDSGEVVEARISGRELTLDRRSDGVFGVVTEARLRLAELGGTGLAAFFEGKSIEFIDRDGAREVVVREGTLTGCDRADPHYRVEAREIELSENQSVTARHAGVRLWGTKLVSVPVLRFGLGKGEGASPWPRLGVTETSGPFVRWAYDLPVGGEGTYDVMLQYSTRRSATWRVRAEGTQPVRLFLYAAGKEELFNRRERGIVVSTLPRFGLRAISGPFALTADYGYYREAPSGVHERRRSIQATYEPSTWDIASWARLSLEGTARRSWYPSGDPFKVSTGDLSAEFDLSTALMLRLGYSRAWTNHRTPFLFDDVDIEHEARAGFRLTRGWGGFDILARYDLDEHEVFGYEISLSRNLHCLAPRLTYSSRDRSVGLEIGIPGF